MTSILIPSDFHEYCSLFTSAQFIHIPKTGGSYVKNLKDYKGDLLFKSLGHKCFLQEDSSWPVEGRDWDIDDNRDFKSLIRQNGNQILDNSENIILDSVLLFSIIRNPFDLLASYWAHDDFFGWEGCNYYIDILQKTKEIRASTVERKKPSKRSSELSPLHMNKPKRVKIKHHFDISFETFIHEYCDSDKEWHRPAIKKMLFFQMFDKNGKCQIPIVIRNEMLNEGLVYLAKGIYGRSFRHRKKINKNKKKNSYKEYYNRRLIKLVEKKCQYELETFGYDFDGPTDNRGIIDCRNLVFKH